MKDDTLETIKFVSDLVIFSGTMGVQVTIENIMNGEDNITMILMGLIMGVIFVVATVANILSTRILKKRQEDEYESIYKVEIKSLNKEQQMTKMWKTFVGGPWLPYLLSVLGYILIIIFNTIYMINIIIYHNGGQGFGEKPPESEFVLRLLFCIVFDIFMSFYVYFGSLKTKKNPSNLFADLRRESMTFDEASEIFDSAKKIHLGMWNTDRYLFYIGRGMGKMISKEDIEHIYIEKGSIGYTLCIESKQDGIYQSALEPFSLNRVRKIISE